MPATATRDAARSSRPCSISSRRSLAFVGLLAASEFAGGPVALAAARLVVGAAFLGAVSDAMLLGHWYLVQPGLRRDALEGARRAGPRSCGRSRSRCSSGRPAWCRCSTAPSTTATTACSRGSGSVCAVTTIGLVAMTWLALRERYYSAVMAATGLLYLAILTAFGIDLIPRAVLAP